MAKNKKHYNFRDSTTSRNVDYFTEKIVGSNDRRTYNRSQTFVSKATLRNDLDNTRNAFSNYVASVKLEKTDNENKLKDQQKSILKLGRTIKMQKSVIQEKNEEINQLKAQMRCFIYQWTNAERLENQHIRQDMVEKQKDINETKPLSDLSEDDSEKPSSVPTPRIQSKKEHKPKVSNEDVSKSLVKEGANKESPEPIPKKIKYQTKASDSLPLKTAKGRSVQSRHCEFKSPKVSITKALRGNKRCREDNADEDNSDDWSPSKAQRLLPTTVKKSTKENETLKYKFFPSKTKIMSKIKVPSPSSKQATLEKEEDMVDIRCYECDAEAINKDALTNHLKQSHTSDSARLLMDEKLLRYNWNTQKTFMMSSGNKIYFDHIPLYSLETGRAIKREIIQENQSQYQNKFQMDIMADGMESDSSIHEMSKELTNLSSSIISSLI